MRRTTLVAAAFGCFVLGLVIGTAQIPIAFAAKHWKNPPKFAL